MDTNPGQPQGGAGNAALWTDLERVRRRARGDQRRASLPLLVLGVYAAGLGSVGALSGGPGLGGPQFIYAFLGLHASLAVLAAAHYRRSARLGAGALVNPYTVTLLVVWLVLSPFVAALCLVAPLGVCSVILLIAAGWARSALLAVLAAAVGAVALSAIRWPSVSLIEAAAAILLTGSLVAYRRERSP